jgi:hypothetical protein
LVPEDEADSGAKRLEHRKEMAPTKRPTLCRVSPTSPIDWRRNDHSLGPGKSTVRQYPTNLFPPWSTIDHAAAVTGTEAVISDDRGRAWAHPAACRSKPFRGDAPAAGNPSDHSIMPYDTTAAARQSTGGGGMARTRRPTKMRHR